jgi:hypothetical protein
LRSAAVVPQMLAPNIIEKKNEKLKKEMKKEVELQGRVWV